MKIEKNINVSPHSLPIKEVSIEKITYINESSKTVMSNRLIYLFYIEEGNGCFIIDNKPFTVNIGNTVVIKTKTPFFYKSVNNLEFKLVKISISCSYLDTMLESYSISSGTYYLDSKINFNNLVNIVDNENNSLTVFYIINNIHEIIIKTASAIYNKHNAFSNTIKNAIEQHIYSTFNLSEVANELGLTTITFIRHFKSAFNITPYQYLLSKRLEYAKTLLQTSNLPIKSISNMFRFSDENYFNYYFKKKVGLSPTEYRKKYLTKQ